MAATAAPSPSIVGRRLLGEVEETSLEDVLQRVRTETAARAAAGTGHLAQHRGGHHGRPGTSGSASAVSPAKNAGAAPGPALRLPSFPIPALQQLVARHFRSTRAPELVAGGQRPLALVYLLVATLVAAPLRQTVVVVDAEARFDPRQLLGVQPRASAVDGSGIDEEGDDASHILSEAVTEDDLQHVHVFRVDPRWRVPLAELVAAAEQRVLYGGQRRRDRPWWGTIVVGGASGSGRAADGGNINKGGSGGGTASHGVGAALVTGPYGWLRIDRQGRDAVEVHQERQRKLLALFETVNLNQHSQDEEQAEAAPDTKVIDSEAFEPVIWAAGSPWGSFTFQLSKLATVESTEESR
ncbi:hypothetical protein SBRCBS47491_002558 [Sporothrix bragantina]|uniref:Uncharacterized protein n=1 Tax=Sporothrix bragantina TaxID=671064 RepID=A0ABP0B812_9PEZI